MKTAFIDSDIILDVLARREPFFVHSARVLTLCEQHEIKGCTTAVVFANLYYLLSKIKNKDIARSNLRNLRIILDVIPLTDRHVDLALNSKFTDFEDALQYFSAEGQELERIITRNISDYRHSEIPVSNPQEFLDVFDSQ